MQLFLLRHIARRADILSFSQRGIGKEYILVLKQSQEFYKAVTTYKAASSAGDNEKR
jgi:hypothetical protein